MADSSSPQPASRPRRPFWRYSLRALLIFFTLACVGVWYWFRVPYREELVLEKERPIFIEPTWRAATLGQRARSREVYFAAKEVRRFRRVLRGDPIREGMTEYFDKEGRRLGEESWRDGQRHGRFMRWYPSGKVHEQGRYDLGAKTGVWELFDAAGNLVMRTPYDANWPHGEAQWFADGMTTRTVRYHQGEVTQIDGREVDDPLGRARREGRIDDRRIAQMLEQPATADFAENPLDEVAYYIATNYKVNVVLDKLRLSSVRLTEDTPITLHEDDRVTAQLMLILLCEPYDMAASYRFGMIWITTKGSAKNWTDETGVSQVLEAAPSNALQESRERIAAAWSRPATFDFLDTACSDVARYVAGLYHIPLECDERVRDVPVTSSYSGISLQNALSALCDQHKLCVRWKDAGSLIVEPREATAPSPGPNR